MAKKLWEFDLRQPCERGWWFGGGGGGSGSGGSVKRRKPSWAGKMQSKNKEKKPTKKK